MNTEEKINSIELLNKVKGIIDRASWDLADMRYDKMKNVVKSLNELQDEKFTIEEIKEELSNHNVFELVVLNNEQNKSHVKKELQYTIAWKIADGLAKERIDSKGIDINENVEFVI